MNNPTSRPSKKITNKANNERRLIGLALVGVCVVFVLVGYFNLMEFPLMPRCLFHQLTGLNCPGCGSTRAIYALAHGHPVDAFLLNPFLIIAIPILVCAAYGTLATGPKADRINEFLSRPVVLWSILALILLWWVVRNLIGI